ncbi:ribonucleoside-diphosphate reductase subunit alpha [Wolbachia endosymbiont of Cruorifilaria tuberocauda]|uniref:ribonucleoside-diphosphate reductase subunit alpha n=1 Tax=Wolbachia endosymbiont of Cruorifilaria tuberocauda TaxID=1812111 RepID=UPI001588BC20|nr:ribonucleoside-diphosphate reductase subunit alpha [Wolbachia endosymbiont of Cruorifilaria tuberocauda]QKX01940.1 ribonucleoside-diphosphate reductase subunit alpha [Wolbachia endosymbiont of Cruorifilaria tuberocauda]
MYNKIKKESMNNITINYGKDAKLTSFGKAVLLDRYLIENESYQNLFTRIASYYSDNDDHAQRLYDYMSNLWFMPSTPILSNGGTDRGLPISCFLNETEDSLKGIVDLWNENVWLAARGGGIGSYWGNLRSIGESVRGSGKTSGIVPFIVVQNALTLAISQGSLRRGSSAVYLPVSHPEIEEFLDIRKPTGGDPNRKALNIHHAVIVNDEFMHAIERDLEWNLVSPHSNKAISTVKARDIWIKILIARIETGEPYIIFLDAINNNKPESYKKLNLDIKMSNLCSEITLTTGYDHLNKPRTAVCCLSSVNLEYYEEWKDSKFFIEDIMRFLDNVFDDFINKAPDEIYRAKYSAVRERSIGLGVMGFHSFLQSKMVPFESVTAQQWNKRIFKHLREQADIVSKKLAEERGACLDAKEINLMERFTHKLAIAPTASISIIAGNTSPGIEPYAANVFTQKTLTGSFVVRNKFLQKLLAKKNQDTDKVWSSISTNEGSVQHLDFLNEYEKLIFKTAYELDQKWIIEHASDRTPYICQSQAVNLFLPANVHKRYLHKIHMFAWRKNLKSLYYCRSQSIQRAEKVSHDISKRNEILYKKTDIDYEECLSCQ